MSPIVIDGITIEEESDAIMNERVNWVMELDELAGLPMDREVEIYLGMGRHEAKNAIMPVHRALKCLKGAIDTGMLRVWNVTPVRAGLRGAR